MSTDLFSAYDLWSGAYDALDNPLVALAERALAAHLPSFAGLSVVELGCGTGRNAAPILAAGARYHGLDGSPGMLSSARARGLPATFELADITAAGDAGHDVAVFCLVLEHSERLEPALSAAASRLRPGGRLLIFELDAELHAAGVAAHFEHGGKTIALPSYAHSVEELAAASRACGFEVERVQRLAPSADDVARSGKLARYVGKPVLTEVCARKR